MVRVRKGKRLLSLLLVMFLCMQPMTFSFAEGQALPFEKNPADLSLADQNLSGNDRSDQDVVSKDERTDLQVDLPATNSESSLPITISEPIVSSAEALQELPATGQEEVVSGTDQGQQLPDKKLEEKLDALLKELKQRETSGDSVSERRLASGIQHFDLMLAIDSSGSMDSNDPKDYRIKGSYLAIDRIRTGDRVGIIDFDDRATEVCPITKEHASAKAALGRIDSSGGTDIYEAVDRALESFKNQTQTGARRILILLTDGESYNNDTQTKKYGEAARKLGIEIYTIGFGSVNGGFLELLAREGNGFYEYVRNERELLQVFSKILHRSKAIALTGKSANFEHISTEGGYKAVDPINTATGAQEIEKTLFDIQGSLPVRFVLRYNSLMTKPGVLGKAWVHEFESRLSFPADKIIRLQWDSQRASDFYQEAASPNLYFATNQNFVNDRLIQNADGTYTLHRADQKKYTYDEQGKLIYYANRHNQSLRLDYQGDRLNSINDDVTRTYINFEHDADGRISKITDPQNNEYRFMYDEENNLTKIIDVQGDNTADYTYNSDGQILEASKDGWRTLTFVNEYDAQGRIVSQDDARSDNRLTTISYDEESEAGFVITTVTDRNGDSYRVKHDIDYRLVEFKDAKGRITRYEYDIRGNCIKVIDPQLQETRYEYSAANDVIKVTDPDGKSLDILYDERHNPVLIRDGRGGQYIMNYDADNNLTTMEYPTGKTIAFRYNDKKQLVEKTLENGSSVQYAYVDGYLSSVTYPGGYVYRLSCDNLGRVVSLADEVGNVTNFDYDSNSHITRITLASGAKLLFEYDHKGNLIKTTLPKGETVRFEYDGNGNLIEETNPAGEKYTYVYDGEDRLIEKIYPSQHSEKYTYDPTGNVISHRDAMGNVTSHIYDSLDRLEAMKDTNGQIMIALSYGSTGEIESIRNAYGDTISLARDANGNVTQMRDPLGNISKYIYDENDRLIGSESGAGQRVSTAYDAMGQVLSMHSGGDRRSYEYDELSRLIAVKAEGFGTRTYRYGSYKDLPIAYVNGNGRQTAYTYNESKRLSKMQDEVGTIDYEYDLNGNVTEVRENGKAMSFEYDALGRITKYRDVRGNVLSYTYDRDGNLTTVTYPDGKKVSYAYDANGNMTQVTDFEGRKTAYVYDVRDLLIKATYPNGSYETYVYDKGHRLTKKSIFTKNHVLVEEYQLTYDKAGKLTEEKAKNLAMKPQMASKMQYAAGNRLTKYGDTSIEYDLEGNMIRGPIGASSDEFSYDARNRLIRVGNSFYEYDALDGRISKTENGVRTDYIINPIMQLSQVLVSTSGQETTYYVYGLNLIGQQNAKGYYTYHSDIRGSTVALTDSDSNVVSRYAYGLYGAHTAVKEEVKTPFLFQGTLGVQTDQNGLIYMRSRYYSPQLHRFINEDSVSGAMSRPSSLNRYSYVQGDPANYIDPEGEAVWILASAGVGAAIGIAGQAFGDFLTGQKPNWKDYASAAVGGAVGGAMAGIGAPAAASVVVSSVLKNGTKQGLKYITGEKMDSGWSVAGDIIFDSAVGFLGGKLANKLVYVKPQHNSRWANNTIKKMGTAFFGKHAVKELWKKGLIGEGVGTFAGIVKAKDIFIETFKNFGGDVSKNRNKILLPNFTEEKKLKDH